MARTKLGKIVGARRSGWSNHGPRLVLDALDEKVVPAIVVDTLSDAVTHSGTSLRDAIATANAIAIGGQSETIRFHSSLSGATITLAQGQLDLSGAGPGSITIDGSDLSSPITISGNNSSRVFEVDAGVNAWIRSLIITGGRIAPPSASYEGGGIWNGGNLRLTGNTLQGNHAYAFGAAVYNHTSGSLSMSSNLVQYNTQSGGGGGEIGMISGAAIYNRGTAYLSSNSISNNTVDGQFGGVFNETAASLVMSGDIVSNHSRGGVGNRGTAIISHVNVNGNQAGGVSNSGTLTITNSTVSGNLGSGANWGIIFGDYHGGAGVFNQGSLSIHGSTISLNTSAGLYGGGVLNNGGTMSISNSTIAGNSSLDGAGIFSYATSSGVSTQISNTTVTNNTATLQVGGVADGVGGIYMKRGTLVLLNSIVSGNYYWELYQYPDPGSERNLIETNANLGSLAYNGGPTQTAALLSGSPAIGRGGPVSTLASSIGSSETSVTVSLGGAIARTAGRYIVRIDSELILVTNVSGNTLTVVRGYGGTTPASHTAGADVFLATDQRGYRVTGVRDIGAYQTKVATQAPSFTSPTITSVSVGSPVNFVVEAAGFPMPRLTLADGDRLPVGVTFNPLTGQLSGTPQVGSGGTYMLHFIAANGIGSSASQTFSLLVNEPAAITSASSTSVDGGSPLNFLVTTRGFPVPTLSIAPGDVLPPGVVFNPGTGSLSGVPAPGSGGTYTLHFTASNGVGAPATQVFTLTVVNVPISPAFTSASNASFVIGTAGSFTVTATGWPAPTLSEDAGDVLPSGVTFNPATGSLSGVPAAGTAGTYTLHFVATNGVGSPASQTFVLTVNQVPAITSVNHTTFVAGSSGTFTVTATGWPTPTLSVSGVLPAGITFDPMTGALSGTPGTNTGGAYALTITATNGVGSPASQSFTLTVHQAPAITSTASSLFTAGVFGAHTVTTTGFPKPSLTLAGALPAGVTFNPATGVLSGAPALGMGGNYPLTISASNGVGTDVTQDFVLMVAQAPTITSVDSATFVPGLPGTFVVTGTGTPAPSFQLIGAPSWLGINSTTGVLGGTPPSFGVDPVPFVFDVVASNGVGAPAVQTFTLTVDAAPGIDRVLRRNGGNIELFDHVLHSVVFSQAITDPTPIVILGSNIANDSLTIDFNFGGSFTVPIGSYYEGAAGSDFVRAIGDVNWAITNTNMFAGGFLLDLNGVERAALVGGMGANVLDSSIFSGRTWFTGGLGNDTFRGGVGIDTVMESGDVNFTLTNSVLTGLGTDSLTGLDRVILTGGAGNNVINASRFTLGSVTLNGGAGNDSLFGGTRSDTFRGDSGDDRFVGGYGVDLVVESGNVNFALTNASLKGVGNDSMIGVESVSLTGGDGNNTIDAALFSGATTLDGGLGDDSIIGGRGRDLLTSGAGNDTIVGGAGYDCIKEQVDASMALVQGTTISDGSLTSALGNDVLIHNTVESAYLIGGPSPNVLNATLFSGRVTLEGGGAGDILIGGKNSDLLIGGDGNDSLTGGSGNDTFQGGAGDDQVADSCTISFKVTSASMTGSGVDRLTGIEDLHLAGSSGNNTFTLVGWLGQASLDGSGGIDRAVVSTDTNYALHTNQLIRSSAGLIGLTSIERAHLIGGSGDNSFDLTNWTAFPVTVSGGLGSDRLICADLIGNTTMRLSTNTLTRDTGSSVSLSSIEQAKLVGGINGNVLNAAAFAGRVTLDGGNGNDLLVGTSRDDLLIGGIGDDTLKGGYGRDFVVGGFGSDSLTGDRGDDILANGTTAYDLDGFEFGSILSEWRRTDQTYTQRVTHLRFGGGLNGMSLLSPTSMLNDSSPDVVTGGLEQDWFFALVPEDGLDRSGTEELN